VITGDYDTWYLFGTFFLYSSASKKRAQLLLEYRRNEMLSAKAIEALVVTGKQYDVADGRVSGLHIRVSQRGAKTFVLKYRFLGTQRRERLGRYPDLTLAEARTQAQEIVSKVRRGADPHAKHIRQDDSYYQLGTLMEIYLKDIAITGKRKPRTLREKERIIRKVVLPPWQKRDVRQVINSRSNSPIAQSM